MDPMTRRLRIEFQDLPEHIDIASTTMRLDEREGQPWSPESQVRMAVWDEILPFLQPKPLPSPDYIPDITLDMNEGRGQIHWAHGGSFTVTEGADQG